eukprot:scaffold2318_cov160-Pinguiococcus_pyrenoidosus.AAC.1
MPCLASANTACSLCEKLTPYCVLLCACLSSAWSSLVACARRHWHSRCASIPTDPEEAQADLWNAVIEKDENRVRSILRTWQDDVESIVAHQEADDRLSRNSFLYACSEGDVRIVDIFLEYDLNFQVSGSFKPEHKKSALQFLARCPGAVEVVKKLLAKLPDDERIDYINDDGGQARLYPVTAFAIAFVERNRGVYELLAEKGADAQKFNKVMKGYGDLCDPPLPRFLNKAKNSKQDLEHLQFILDAGDIVVRMTGGNQHPFPRPPSVR